MSFSSLGFLIEEAAKNIRRNGLMSLAALSTVTLAMAVFGGALVALHWLHHVIEVQPKQFEMEAFVKTDIPKEKVEALIKRVEALPNVAAVKLYPKEKAWSDTLESDRKSGTNVASVLEDNPLPDRLDVRLDDQRKTAATSAALHDAKQFPEIEQVRDASDVLGKIYSISSLVRNIGGVAAILLFLATALVIQNTIRLTVFARRREIRIMQLVGATSSFIRLPMMLEGIFYGVVGAAVAGGLVVLVVAWVSSYLQSLKSPLAIPFPEAVGPALVIGGLATLGAMIGWLGSTLSVRKFLKQI